MLVLCCTLAWCVPDPSSRPASLQAVLIIISYAGRAWGPGGLLARVAQLCRMEIRDKQGERCAGYQLASKRALHDTDKVKVALCAACAAAGLSARS